MNEYFRSANFDQFDRDMQNWLRLVDNPPESTVQESSIDSPAE